MVDYTGAFRQGLEAAEAAERAKQEIAEVFIDLDKQIRTETNEKLAISRDEYEVSSPTLAAMASLAAVALGQPRKTEIVWYITAHNPSIPKSSVKKLAKWTEDRAGYPCALEWGGDKYVCEDREALEKTIADMLKDPIVGEKLQVLLRLKLPSPEQSSSEGGEASDG